MTRRFRWEAIVARCPNEKIIRGAEVGVWNGKNAEQLLRLLPLLCLTLVDRWAPPTSNDAYYKSGSKIARQSYEEHKQAYFEAIERTKFASDRIDIRISDTAQAALEYADGMFDFVFIDGDHSHEGCYRDIVAWAPKVKPGGFIGGHDYDHPAQGDVKGAVLRYFGGEDGIEIDVNRTWFREME